MRNYLKFSKQDFDIFDGSDPMNPVQIGTLSHVEDDDEDAAAFAASLPSAGNTFYVPQAAAYPYWPLLDKSAIKNVLNQAAPGSFNAFIAQQADDGSPEFNPDWPTSDGDIGRKRQDLPRTGKGSSGSKTDLEVFKNTLVTLYTTFLTAAASAGEVDAARLTREAKQILSILNNLILKKITLAEAVRQTDQIVGDTF